ncbi:kinase-like protein [Apiospora hydei]|uniref:non-specific serine/threonine protein kinase n=1 Tax=Apiospora hydei TaxID=1337664 RepID=A0ABR1VTK6_9PEZI
MPHPLALFSLAPRGKRAQAIVDHALNQHLVSLLGTQRVLDVGHIRSKDNNNALVTLGRDGDIYLEGSSISKTQCAFEIDSNNVVMFYDRSHSQTSQVSGANAKPFQPGRGRKVVVQQNLNTIIGMGDQRQEAATLEENPRFARTIDVADTVAPSRRETRIHTPGPQQSGIRYYATSLLGAGAFGEVRKAIDVDSGLVMAVKAVRPPSAIADEAVRMKFYQQFKREVEALSSCKHPCILDFIWLDEWDGFSPKIFMGLKDGTLTSLIRSGAHPRVERLSQTVLHHMLQALDYLTCIKGIIHRDVKPDNILYVVKDGQYHFQLGDMGLSNQARLAVTKAGTQIFMAPELTQEKPPQTDKLDVWSLFVTMLWTLDSDGFRAKAQIFTGELAAQSEVLRLADDPNLAKLADMGRADPEKRASAAQMLIKNFEGKGLVTARAQVPPIGGTPAPIVGVANSNPATENIQATNVVTPPAVSPPRKQRHTTPLTPGGGPRTVKPNKPQAMDTRAGAGRVVKSRRLPRASPAAAGRVQRALSEPKSPASCGPSPPSDYSPSPPAYYASTAPSDDTGDPMDLE